MSNTFQIIIRTRDGRMIVRQEIGVDANKTAKKALAKLSASDRFGARVVHIMPHGANLEDAARKLGLVR